MMKKRTKQILILLGWLVVWQMAAILIHNDILLAGPVEVLKTFIGLLGQSAFYKACAASMGRILSGFFLAVLTGIVLGGLCYAIPFMQEMLKPALSVLKSVPVVSFIVLLLIWQGSKQVALWVSFLVVFPNACTATINGLMAVDAKLKEMADLFHIRGFKRLLYLYRPAFLPFMISAMEISVGMAFKSGVAAEVIGMPQESIGERIYMSKVYLDTPALFAWTLSLILLSFLVEKCLIKVMKLLLEPTGRYTAARLSKGSRQEEAHTAGDIIIQDISKSYGNKQVLSHFSGELKKGGRYLLMAPSGSGKTTLLRLMAGLEKPDQGTITFAGGRGKKAVSYLFQEDRLFENEFTITNIMSTTNKKNKGETNQAFYDRVEETAAKLLPRECLDQPAKTLSGGMKRRCALIRAMLYETDPENGICLLDEPFAGLDSETKKKAIAFIEEHLHGRTLVVASHDEEDAALLGGSIWNINELP